MTGKYHKPNQQPLPQAENWQPIKRTTSSGGAGALKYGDISGKIALVAHGNRNFLLSRAADEHLGTPDRIAFMHDDRSGKIRVRAATDADEIIHTAKISRMENDKSRTSGSYGAAGVLAFVFADLRDMVASDATVTFIGVAVPGAVQFDFRHPSKIEKYTKHTHKK